MQLDIHIKRLSVVKLMTKIKIEVGQIYHKNGLLGKLILEIHVLMFRELKLIQEAEQVQTLSCSSGGCPWQLVSNKKWY